MILQLGLNRVTDNTYMIFLEMKKTLIQFFFVTERIFFDNISGDPGWARAPDT